MFVFICVALLSCKAYTAEDLAKIEVGYVEFPPMFSTNTQGVVQGRLADVLDKVITHAGYEFSAVALPPKRLFLYLSSGTIDLWLGLVPQSILQKEVLIGRSVVAELKLHAYAKKGTPALKDMHSLRNKDIIIIRGYSYGGWIEYIMDPLNNINVIETTDHIPGLHLLKKGRADYLLDYKSPIDFVLRNNKFENIQAFPLSRFPVRFVVSKKSSNAKKLLHDLESSYKNLITKKILQKSQ